MAYFNEFPHTRTYDSDLAWLIDRMKELMTKMDSVDKLLAEVQRLIDELPEVIRQRIQQIFNELIENKFFDALIQELLSEMVGNVWRFGSVGLRTNGVTIKCIDGTTDLRLAQSGFPCTSILIGGCMLRLAFPKYANLSAAFTARFSLYDVFAAIAPAYKFNIGGRDYHIEEIFRPVYKKDSGDDYTFGFLIDSKGVTWPVSGIYVEDEGEWESGKYVIGASGTFTPNTNNGESYLDIPVSYMAPNPTNNPTPTPVP